MLPNPTSVVRVIVRQIFDFDEFFSIVRGEPISVTLICCYYNCDGHHNAKWLRDMDYAKMLVSFHLLEL
jgi:hypothetical protein